jgi:predicted site-specific integrase-resolvase
MEQLYYNYSEAAEILGIKMTTLYSYIWQRKLVPIKRPGFKSVFKKTYIDRIAKCGAFYR